MTAKRLLTSFATMLVLAALIWVSWPHVLKTMDVAPLVVEEAQIMAPFKGAAATAGYLVIRSRTTQPLTIKAVKSPAFGRIELHSTDMSGGVMRMRHLEGLAVPAFGTVSMGHGGVHLMMFDPTRTVAPGAPVPLYLELEGVTQPITIVAPVVPR